MLNRLQAIPFEIELRDSLDAALYHFERLGAATAEALSAQDETTEAFKAAAKDKTIDRVGQLGKQSTAQRMVFDYLDAFLGAFARVSFLIYPVASAAFAKERGATMQSCLGVDDSSPVANRELRGSWTHHDERIDFAVENGLGASGQTFTRSSDITAEKKKTFLRLIELDTLVVHYRTRNGDHQSADLNQVYSALQALDAVRITAFDQLSMPDVVSYEASSVKSVD